MAEVLVLVIEAIGASFSFLDHSRLLGIFKANLDEAFFGEDNWLLYVRNPVKVLLMLVELLDSKLHLTSSDSLLRH